MDKKEFWWCEDCVENYIYDEKHKRLLCYKNISDVNNERKLYNFYFKIDTFSQIGLESQVIIII